MSTFTPCKGKTACRDDAERCLVCGRDFAEIEATRALIDAVTEFVLAQDYANRSWLHRPPPSRKTPQP